MARQRSASAFNLSFLDVMSCGFGAVVLMFLIMDHAIKVQSSETNSALLSEAQLLEEEVLLGEEGLVRLRNTISSTDFDVVEARGLASRIGEEIDSYRELLESLESEERAGRGDLGDLRAEVRALEQEVRALRASSEESGKVAVRSFLGEGNRQYLTGLKLGGRNIMILLDASASMLAPELVNVIRLRNMGDAVKKSADKWQRAIRTVEWLGAQLPADSEYQIYSFNTRARPLLEGSEGTWLRVSDRQQLNRVLGRLGELVPADGTSLENALAAALDMAPPPDNIFLLTDGLPTQGAQRPRGNKINAAERLKLFARAVSQLPDSIPVNIILAPMEGDTMAASEFWKLAQATSGSFLSPSKDWP